MWESKVLKHELICLHQENQISFQQQQMIKQIAAEKELADMYEELKIVENVADLGKNVKKSGVNTNNSKIKIKMLQKIFVSVHIGKTCYDGREGWVRIINAGRLFLLYGNFMLII